MIERTEYLITYTYMFASQERNPPSDERRWQHADTVGPPGNSHTVFISGVHTTQCQRVVLHFD